MIPHFHLIDRTAIAQIMVKLIDCVRKRAEGPVQRIEKAERVKEIARALLVSWKENICESKGTSWYMHGAYHHLPDMIRRLPVDVLEASGDSFEHKNQDLKRMTRRLVNSSCIIHIIFYLMQSHQQEKSIEAGASAWRAEPRQVINFAVLSDLEA